MSSGYVYVLSNPAMPRLVKIGKSQRGARKRADELYQTGVPAAFVVEFEILTPDHEWVEREAHNRLSQYRVNRGREFFAVDATDASREVMSCVALTWDMELCMPDLIVRTDELRDLAVRAGVDASYPGLATISQAVSLMSPEEVRAIIDRWEENLRARSDR